MKSIFLVLHGRLKKRRVRQRVAKVGGYLANAEVEVGG